MNILAIRGSQAGDSNDAAPRSMSSGLAIDSFVMLSMSLVSLALGTALHLQLGMSFLIAVIAALSLYLCLLALHALVRRTEKTGLGGATRKATIEDERLTSEPAPSLEPQIGAETLNTNEPASTENTGSPAPEAVAAAVSGIAANRLEVALGKSRPSKASDLAGLNPSDDADAPFEPVLPAWPDPDQTDAENKAAAVADEKAKNAEVRETVALADPAKETNAAPPPVPQPDPVAAQAISQAPDASAHTQSQPIAPPSAARPSAPPPPTANTSAQTSGPSVADVEMVGGLIKELADRVNASEGAPAAPASPATPPKTLTEQVAANSTAQSENRTPPATSEPAAPRPVPSSTKPTRTPPTIPTASQVLAAAASAPQPKQSDAAPQQAAAPSPMAARPVETDDPSVDALRQAVSEMREYEPAANQEAVASPPPVGPAQTRLSAIAEALAADRVSVRVEPIVTFADQVTGHFDLRLCLRDASGNIIDIREHVDELAGTGLLALLDTERVSRCARAARHLKKTGRTGSVMARFSTEGLRAEQFLDAFAEACRIDPHFSEQLVLVFSQQDVRSMGDLEWATLNDMKDIGFRFALADVTARDMDFSVLKEMGFTYVKMEAVTFLNGLRSGEYATSPEELCQEFETAGMLFVVEKIVDEATLARVVDLGAGSGQGAVLGAYEQLDLGATPQTSKTAAA